MDRCAGQTGIAETSRGDRRAQTAGERRRPADHRRNAQLLPGLHAAERGDDDRARILRPDDEAAWGSSQSRFALGRGDGRQGAPCMRKWRVTSGEKFKKRSSERLNIETSKRRDY